MRRLREAAADLVDARDHEVGAGGDACSGSRSLNAGGAPTPRRRRAARRRRGRPRRVHAHVGARARNGVGETIHAATAPGVSLSARSRLASTRQWAMQLVVDLRCDERRPHPGQHQRVDRARVPVALEHDLVAEVREREPGREVALRGAVDEEPRAPCAPRLGGQALLPPRTASASARCRIPHVSARMSWAGTPGPTCRGGRMLAPLWPGMCSRARVARGVGAGASNRARPPGRPSGGCRGPHAAASYGVKRTVITSPSWIDVVAALDAEQALVAGRRVAAALDQLPPADRPRRGRIRAGSRCGSCPAACSRRSGRGAGSAGRPRLLVLAGGEEGDQLEQRIAAARITAGQTRALADARRTRRACAAASSGVELGQLTLDPGADRDHPGANRGRVVGNRLRRLGVALVDVGDVEDRLRGERLQVARGPRRPRRRAAATERRRLAFGERVDQLLAGQSSLGDRARRSPATQTWRPRRRRSRRRSACSRSARISSVSIVSMSAERIDAAASGWTARSESPCARTTWQIASVSRIEARNWLPSPSPRWRFAGDRGRRCRGSRSSS